MIRLLVRFGKWLDSRFPAKLVVTTEQYEQLHTELSMVRGQLSDMALSLNKALERLSVVESNAVHKEPVQTVISELDKLKNEYSSFKASMGYKHQISPEIQAMLNGEVI